MFLGYVSHNYFNISPCGAPRLRNHTGNSSFHVGPPPTVRYSVPAPSMTSTLNGQERRWTVNFIHVESEKLLLLVAENMINSIFPPRILYIYKYNIYINTKNK